MRDARVILLLCAGLLLSGGIILFGFSTWSLMRMSYYFWTTDLGLELACLVLFLAAGLLCLPISWLTTIVPYHPKVLHLQGTLTILVISTMMLLGLGLVSCAQVSRALSEHTAVNASMRSAMTLEPREQAVRRSFADMQLDLKCCGVQSYRDWFKVRPDLPASCCGDRMCSSRKGVKCIFPQYVAGCLKPAIADIRNTVSALSTFGAALIVVLAITLSAAAYLVGVYARNGYSRTGAPPAFRVAWLQGQPSAPQQSLAPCVPVQPQHVM